jgi:hypothetical protein
MAKTTKKKASAKAGPGDKSTLAGKTTKKTAAKKKVVKKAAAKKTAAKKAPAVRKKAVAKKATAKTISAARRHEMIAQAAYLLSESQGFLGSPDIDWLQAEAEVDAKLAKAGIKVTG